MNKPIMYLIGAVVVIGGIWYFRSGTSAPIGESISPSPSMSVAVSPNASTPFASTTPKKSPSVSWTAQPTATVTPTPTATATPISTATPTSTPSPTLIVQESVIFDVTIENFVFSPSPVTVKRGDVVVFRNRDSVTHTATSLNRVFDSANIRPGDSWTLATANLTPGTYEYRCTPHPSMRGTIIVE